MARLQCIEYNEVVQGGPRRSKVVQGCPWRSKAVQGGPRRSMAVHGGPRLSKVVQCGPRRYNAVRLHMTFKLSIVVRCSTVKGLSLTECNPKVNPVFLYNMCNFVCSRFLKVQFSVSYPHTNYILIFIFIYSISKPHT